MARGLLAAVALAPPLEPLQEPLGLRRQTVLEALVGVHLHLQENHRELRAAGFDTAGGVNGPEHTDEVVAQLFSSRASKR